jgi:hypothetical protein
MNAHQEGSKSRQPGMKSSPNKHSLINCRPGSYSAHLSNLNYKSCCSFGRVETVSGATVPRYIPLFASFTLPEKDSGHDRGILAVQGNVHNHSLPPGNQLTAALTTSRICKSSIPANVNIVLSVSKRRRSSDTCSPSQHGWVRRLLSTSPQGHLALRHHVLLCVVDSS